MMRLVPALALAGCLSRRRPDSAGAEAGAGPGWHGNRMFAGMSEAGRATMRAALRGADPRGERAAVEAARDRMLAILDAERLDPVALKRAMDDERETASAAKARHQAALLAGFQQLSPADRHAFVANARAMRTRIEDRVEGMRGRREPGEPGMTLPPQ